MVASGPESLHNFRDLGGLHTDDDRVVRRGLVHRSDELLHLTGEEWVALRDEVGIRTVVDLRAPLEHEGLGRYDVERLGLHVVELPVLDDEVMRTNANEPDFDMAVMYRRIVHHGAPCVRRVLELVADGDRLPMVMACTSGKDRTGLVTAVLLAALGVRRADIVADYERSAATLDVMQARVQARMAGAGVAPPAAAFRLHTDHLLAELDRVAASFDALVTYLGPGAADVVAGARARVLQPADRPPGLSATT